MDWETEVVLDKRARFMVHSVEDRGGYLWLKLELLP